MKSAVVISFALLLACGDGSTADAGETGGSALDSTGDASTSSTAASGTSTSTTQPSTTTDESSSGSSASSGSDSSGGPPGTGLGIDGEQLTWNGVPTFFVGVSYFDARNWHESDFDGLAERGWNLVRIWLDWGEVGLFGPDGALTPEGAGILTALVDSAAAREIVVDVTILDPGLLFTPDIDHRIAAVQSVATTLADHTNVFYDVMNEHDHGKGPVDHTEAATIVAALREIDADAIVTISSTGGHLVGDDATVQVENVDAETDEVGVAIVTPHLPRTADWADQTDARVTALRGHLQSRGLVLPIYLQEEARRGHSGLEPSEAEFVQSAGEAQTAGAAAWIFHTDAGFELAVATFFDALDEAELAVIDNLPGAI
jgi:hypothetical protein